MIALIANVDVADAQQAKTVFEAFAVIISNGDDESVTGFADNMPTTEPTLGDETTSAATTSSTSTLSPDDGKEQLLKLLGIASKLTETGHLKETMDSDEFQIRLNAAAPVADILNKNGKYANNWEELNQDPNFQGPHGQLQSYRSYLSYITERREEADDANDGEFSRIISGKNFGAEVFKKSAKSYTALGEEGSEYFQFPNWQHDSWKKTIQKWGENPEVYEPGESIEIPNKLFTGICETLKVSFVGSILDTFPDPGRKNPSVMPANEVQLDSRVIVLDVTANEQGTDEDDPDTYRRFGERCLPDEMLLVRNPIVLDFSIMSHRHNFGNLRKLLGYFDELDTSRVRQRHCAIWNPDIGTHGAWDTEGVRMVHASDTKATCHSTKFGTFSIIAEIEDEPSVSDDELWLLITKYIGYGISIALLAVFICCIFLSPYLWEMFHVLGMNMAFAMMMGHILMLVTESDDVRNDRSTCCAIGLAMSFFYIACSTLLAAETFAMFYAIITGLLLF